MQWDVQDPIGESAFVSGRCQKVRLLQSGKNPRRDATPQIHAASGENLERNIANDSTENSHEQVESRDADSCFSIERGRRYDRRSIPRCGEFLPQPFGLVVLSRSAEKIVQIGDSTS